jgi:hypothetical protein
MARRSYTIDQINLPDGSTVEWRYNDAQRLWEVSAYAKYGDENYGLLRSLTDGRSLHEWIKTGPGTDLFASAVGRITVEAVRILLQKS